MKNVNSKTQIYIDVLIAETLLGDPRLLKTAQSGGILSEIVGKVKDYFMNKVNPNDRVGSVLNMLAPGVIRVAFGAMGMPWLGTLLGLADSFFHFDIASILEGIWNKLKEALHSGNGQVNSNQVHEIVQSTVQDHAAPATEQEAEEAAQKLQQSGEGNEPMHDADDGLSLSSQLRTAKLLRLAMEAYARGSQPDWFKLFSSRKSTTGTVLTSVLSLILRVALASAGLMVAGDAMRKVLGLDEHFGGDSNKPSGGGGQAPQPSGPGDTIRNSQSMTWIENITNDQNSIEQMLLQFAHQVYPQLSGKDSELLSDPKFQYMVHTISWYNHENPGSPVVYIPRMFTTKKELVDSFANDLLAKTK